MTWLEIIPKFPNDNVMLLRKKKGLYQADLGKIFGKSGDVIGRYKRGDIPPFVEVVSKIADTLEASVDYLFGKTKKDVDKKTLRIVAFELIPAIVNPTDNNSTQKLLENSKSAWPDLTKASMRKFLKCLSDKLELKIIINKYYQIL